MKIRRAKLVCTLGPACDSIENLKSLISSGMDVARLNFSHGTHEEHRARLMALRQASHECEKPVAILQDLCGPKIRTGAFAKPFDLEQGSTVMLEEGSFSDDPKLIPIQYDGLAEDVKNGDRILFDDGRIVLEIKQVTNGKLVARVNQGGGMRSRIGVHLPSRTVRIRALTDKDKTDLDFGLSLGVEYVALSFVRRTDDIREVKEICLKHGAPVPVIAKIETPDAIENLESVITASDGVMVARGDLGVEFPLEQVPVIQRHILAVARRAHRPVIVATEMLQSMTVNSRPTRAEASDVANAVFSGTDCLMLSGETATGNYPLLSAEMMSRIAVEAEASAFFEAASAYPSKATSVAEAVARGAVNTAREIGARFLVAFTETGSSALNVSLARPHVPIIAFSNSETTRRRMAMYWGVLPREMPSLGLGDTDKLVRWAAQDLRHSNLAYPGERIVIVFGAPIGVSGSTNTIRVHEIS